MCGVTGLSSASPPGFDAVCGMQRQHSGILKFLPIIHNKKNINIINKEIKGFPI